MQVANGARRRPNCLFTACCTQECAAERLAPVFGCLRNEASKLHFWKRQLRFNTQISPHQPISKRLLAGAMVDVIITEHCYKIPSKRLPARLLPANTPGTASGLVFDSNWICSIRNDDEEPQRVTAESIAGNFMTALFEFEVLFLFAANFLAASFGCRPSNWRRPPTNQFR